MLQQIFSLSFMTAFLAAAVRLAVPLMYGGIGETIAEKSGILNIGMEGVMLSGAFFSFAGAWYSGNLFVGLLCGMAGGLIVSLLHGLLSITLIQNQSVSGLAINMLMLGVTSFLFKLMSNGQGYQQIETFPNYEAAHKGGYYVKCLYSSQSAKYMNINIRHALESLDNSIYIVEGEDEPNGAAIVETYQKVNPAIESATIPCSKHFPHIENVEAFLEQVGTFF